MNYYSPHRRIELVKQYNVTPVSHLKLLEDEEEVTSIGRKVTDQYYSFRYNHKFNKEEGGFICGITAAKDFLKLTGHTPLKPFSILKYSKSNMSVGRSSINDYGKPQKWNKVAEQLANAIDIFIILKNIKEVNGVLLDRKLELNKYFYSEPKPWKIKSVNTIISRDSFNNTQRTLQEMLNDKRQDGYNIRKFDFTSLNEILNKTYIGENTLKSFFGD